MQDYLQLHIDGHTAAMAESALEAIQALAVTLGDAADQPILEPPPGETPLWDHVRVTGLFPAGADPLSLLAQLQQQGVDPSRVTVERLTGRVWEREWLREFRPMRFGHRLWISPFELRDQTPPDAAVVALDPGLAFGTGTHPTTRLCLEWLDAADLAGARVLDFGCGSGVLALAAATLGAEAVIATDIDPQALAATRANARANGLEHRIHCRQLAELADNEAFDLVLANILAGTLVDLAGELCARVAPGGQLVLSGILAEQADQVRQAYAGEFLLSAENSDTWVRLDGRRFAPAA